ncbi:MAG: hypothetical protein ACFCUX_08560 [Candidatus Methylacidiphilales bacterium]
MRTTLTLETANAQRVTEYAKRAGISFKEAVNQLLAKGLRGTLAEVESHPFSVKARPMRLRAGIDLGRLNQLADELEVDAFLQTSKRQGRRRR